MTAVVAPLAIGFVFAWLLQRAGLSRYERIVEIFRFRDAAVVQFLLSALVTAAIGLRVLASLGFATDIPIPTTVWPANLGGGFVFGIGMALSGFCPGTVAAGAGEGRLDNLVPGIGGLLSGALIYGLLYPRIGPALARVGRWGAVTLDQLTHTDPGWWIVVLAEVTAITFYAVERGRSMHATHRLRA
ncbi:MAG: YeeE/YedE thiosulfate transporter family protein [Polyangiales bacterium]